MPIANGVVQLLMLLKKLLQKNYRLLKSCLQQLYLNKIITHLLHLVFVFTPGANLVKDQFSCQSDKFKSQMMNSIANRTNSFAKTCKHLRRTLITKTSQFMLIFTPVIFFSEQHMQRPACHFVTDQWYIATW